jgi:hypothetical protein
MLGKLRCEPCGNASGNKITVGTVHGEPVQMSFVLQDVLAEENEHFVLRCGHRVPKIGAAMMLSSQEWLKDYPHRSGSLPMVTDGD